MAKKMAFKTAIVGTAAGLTMIVVAAAAQASPVGVWLAKGENNSSGQVQIYKCGSKLCGKLIWSSSKGALDSKNPNKALRSRKVVGIRMMWGFKPDGKNQWDSGRIYDASSGKTYKCIMRLRAGGKQLHVRGYVGISLLGKTSIWTRIR